MIRFSAQIWSLCNVLSNVCLSVEFFFFVYADDRRMDGLFQLSYLRFMQESSSVMQIDRDAKLR